MVSNPAVQHAISPEEWALRQDLAACYRRDGTSLKPSTFCTPWKARARSRWT